MRLLNTMRLAGAGLLAAAGGIHLDLYLTGYRHIPTIGWLFLLQIIAAFLLAVAVLVVRSPLTDAAGAGFALSTLGGYLLSLWVGLFGFQEVRTTAGLVAGLIEVAAFAVLGYAAVAGLPAGSPLADRVTRLKSGVPGGASGVLGVAAVAALVVLAASVGTASSGAGATPTTASGGSGSVVKIIIKNFRFTPANPDVQPGERIAITNEDSVTHTLTAGPSPKDKGVFTTGDVGPGQTKMVNAPAKAGMYPFFCMIHTFMTGMLIVGK